MSKYIVAVDGGGTKTCAVLYDIHGKELSRHTEGYANFSIDETIAKENIKKAIKGVINAQTTLEDVYIQLGIAGLSNFRAQAQYKKELEDEFNATVSLENDALIALYSVRKDTALNVIMAIGGTGSALMIQDGERHYLRGGFGHLLGDEGSAYHVVIEAFKHVIKEAENNGEFSELSRSLLDAIDKDDYQGIKDFVYNSDKRTVAQLSTLIGQMALNNDTDAIRLLKAEGIALASQITNAYKQLNNQSNVVIALRGGFLLKAPFVKEALIGMIDKSISSYILETDSSEAVLGAYYLAASKLSAR